MKRRDFLKLTMYSTALAGLAGPMSNVLAAVPQRTLVNIMCLGGADFRFMFAPNPANTAYATKFWEARASLYGGGTYQNAWNNLFTETAPGAFGIYNNAGWLQAQYAANNVAIICNVAGSENRRHDQSQLIVNTGDLTAGAFVYDRDGWGGRLAENISAANVVAMTHDVSVFCKGTDPADRLKQVIHARNTKDFALSLGKDPLPPTLPNPMHIQKRFGRALKSYYAAKRDEVANKPADWIYHKFIQHEKKLRDFGDPFKALIDANPAPAAIEALYTNGSGNTL
ncbi:MAG: hypothetical protein OEY07_08390, partial [Gammaproteobacteria bacterium]|nr:hypothetical protein [Gammaproteobacteria bacterium]